MLTSKQRSYLNKLAANEKAIVFIGKSGINSEIVIQALNNLKARELIKCKVLKTAPADVDECAQELAEKTKAEIVRVIGNIFILYKKNLEKKKNLIPDKKLLKNKGRH